MTDQQDGPVVRDITITLRVERDLGTTRAEVLAGLREQVAGIEPAPDSGWRVVRGSADVCFADVGENLSAMRGW